MDPQPAPASGPAPPSSAVPRPPTFLVVGVAKAGTTALYHYLGEHPEVFMSPAKEPAYFVPGFRVETWEEYIALFAGAGDAKAIGEATPRYFHTPESPAWINETLPGVRIVVVLRQPVDRALSHYLMLTNNRAALQPEPFASFFRRHLSDVAHWKEGEVGARGLAISFYAEPLERWFDTFGRDRVAVYLHEDLREEPDRVMAELYGFIGVDPSFRPDLAKRYNVGQGMPKSGVMQRLIYRDTLLKRLARRLVPAALRRRGISTALQLNRGGKPALTPDERREFTAVYRDDIERVERLIGRDLSAWYS